MSRLGYVIAVLCAIALLAYAFWPRGGNGGQTVFPSSWPESFTVSGEGGIQTVSSGRVRVAGLDRPADAEAIKRFQGIAQGLRCPADRVLEGISESDAVHYGIDGRSAFTAGEERRLWGEAGGVGAVLDPARHRLWLLDARSVANLGQSAARLDRRGLADLPKDPQRLIVDGMTATHSQDGHWRFSALRPHADGRIAELLRLARSAQLTSFTGSAPATASVHRLAWDGGELRLLVQETRAWLQAQDVPPQVVQDARSWLTAFTACQEDRLADLPHPVPAPTYVQVQRHGVEILHLERYGEMGEYGMRPWRVVWPGGNEAAASDAGERLLASVAGMTVGNTVPDTTPPPGSLGLAFLFDPPTPPMAFAISPGQANDGSFTGQPVSPPMAILGIAPESLLDPHPCAITPERAVKVQRRWGERTEVISRRPGGTWTRTLPKGGSVDDAACHRLVRALCRIQATSVSLGGAAERAAVQAPAFALEIRFAPVEARRAAADDEVDLEDTMPTERGWACVRSGDGWLMADELGGLSYHVTEADIEALQAALDSDRLCPVAAPLVSAIEVAGTETFRLEHRSGGWILREGGQERRADAVKVRQLLRALGELSSRGQTATPAAVTRTLAVETVDGERIVLRFAAPTQDGIPVITTAGAVLVDPGAAALVDAHKAWF